MEEGYDVKEHFLPKIRQLANIHQTHTHTNPHVSLHCLYVSHFDTK